MDSQHALRAELAGQRERFDSLAAIGHAIASALDLDDILRRVIDHTTRLLQAERSTLYLVDRERNEIWSKVLQGDGVAEIRLPLGCGVAGWVCANDQPVVIANAGQDARFHAQVDKDSGFRTRSMVVVPLHDRFGKVLGAIQALNRLEGEFGPEDERLLQAIAAQAGVAIEKARLFGDLLSKNRELDLLFDIERKISSSSGLDELLDATLATAMDVLGVEAASVLLLEEDSGQLLFQSAQGEKGEQVKRCHLRVGEGIAGEVARSGEPILSNAPASHPSFNGRIGEQVGFQTRGVLCVPLVHNARVLGALEILNKRDRTAFGSSDLRIATLVAGQVARAVVVARERAEGERKGRLAAIGQMIGGLLHDLRTPMTIISGYAELMANEEDRVERAGAAEIILKQLEHINAMARETLAFARGEREILLRKVHLNTFVDEVRQFLARDLEGHAIELTVDARFLGAVRMDEAKMKRAIYNIARNAVQAMPSGGRFRFELDKEGERVVFRLSDTGGGIPQEIAGKLFQSFVTHGKKDGTGLGLAIVKKVVEEHGGDVRFDSTPGVGTTFILSIPA